MDRHEEISSGRFHFLTRISASLKMAVTVLPVLFLFLVGLGGLAQSPAEGAEEVSGRGGVLPLEELKAQMNNNSMALSHLNHLLQSFVGFMSDNPCIETSVANEVADVMAEGFTSVMEAMREVKRAVKILQLISWRIGFVKTLDIPRMDRGTPCPLPFFVLDEECVYLESKVRRSFKTAKLACTLMGGFLAEPANMEKFANYLHKLNSGRNSEVYVGIVSPSTNGVWQWQTSGASAQDIPWASGRPSSAEENGCLVAKEKKYTDIACTKRRIFACEIAL